MVRLAGYVLLLSMVPGCVDKASAPPAVGEMDAEASDAGSSDAAERDAETEELDAAPPSPIDAGGPPCQITARVILPESTVSIFHWGGQAEPVRTMAIEVEGERCGTITTRTSVPWLGAAFQSGADRLRYWLEPDATVSGVSNGFIELLSPDGGVLGRVDVVLGALVGAEDATAHSLLIGVDGIRSDAYQVAHTPNMDLLARAGASTMDASTHLTGSTMSGPGWASIFTGVEVVKHGVENNGALGLPNEYPSYMARLRRELGLRTLAAMQWAPLLGMFEDDALDERTTGDHAEVTDDMVRMLSEEGRAFFIHFDDVDHAGHASGFSINNPEYIEAIERVDIAVGRLMNGILERPGIGAENWMVLMTTDHGGEGTSHGARIPENRRIPFMVAAPDVGSVGLVGGVSHMDVAPTLLGFMGLRPDESWGLDGRPQGSRVEIHCANAIDDDGDGALDCDDPDCRPSSQCGFDPVESDCRDGRDNDVDGQTDCWDMDCFETAPCNTLCAPAELGAPLGMMISSGSTEEADDYFGGSCGGAESPEVYYAWVAPRADTYVFDTIGSELDTVLYLREGNCHGEELACNNRAYGGVRLDTPIPYQSVIRLALEAEQEVTVFVDGATAEGGRYELNATAVGETCPDGELGSEVGDSVAVGNNEAQPLRFLASCAGSARDFTYLWRAPENGSYEVNTIGSTYDTVLFVQRGRCVDDEVVCNDDDVGLQSRVVIEDVAEGDEFTIVLGGFRGRTGNHRLNIFRQ